MPQPAELADTIIVVAGGERPDPRTAAVLPAGAPVLAADSGADHALRLGLRVDELIGDLDSVSPEGRAAVSQAGGRIERFPAAKDFTDLELALQVAMARRPRRIVVVGGHGGRLDHHLSGLLLLGAPWLAPATVSAWQGRTLLSVIRAGTALVLKGSEGSIVTLVPLAGRGAAQVDGITTQGLAYPLADETLAVGTTRGVSNVMLGTEASVISRAGVLLAVQPDALDHHLCLAAVAPSAPPKPPPQEPR